MSRQPDPRLAPSPGLAEAKRLFARVDHGEIVGSSGRQPKVPKPPAIEGQLSIDDLERQAEVQRARKVLADARTRRPR